MALVFLPWMAVVLFTAGGWAALNFLGYAIVVSAAGYGIVSVALPAPARTEAIVLAPAVGILAISALTAFWVRLGLPLIWVPALWLGLMAAGALYLWNDRALWAKSTVAYGGALVVLSVLICAVYFLPGARNDAVLAARRELQLDLRGHAILPLDCCEHQERRQPAESTRNGDRTNFSTILDRMHRLRPFPALTDSTWATPSPA